MEVLIIDELIIDVVMEEVTGQHLRIIEKSEHLVQNPAVN